ncbi:DUF1330 domain-containing protein [Reyranella sp. CPCC 100927]|uniref:DUF1330 domain-containing protein n=1 Tax=Reyranella sp. CPCC 100927 TaxID=2599616 RepID=UPI0011B50ECA|nr:DUF1330 domain-containing protein [Reyranella sp. CPCC 100927]TWT04072.1 DUF1330 domain-containing protein [Reyranella sp. CPCC 100927]
MPAAYVLVQVDVVNPDAFEAYRLKAPDTIRQYGGEYIVRGGAHEKLEGDDPLSRLVVIRFPDKQAANAWYTSPEYRDLLALRKTCARANLVVVEGVA